MAHDWSRFTVRININAPIDKLFTAWTTRAGMEHWFLRQCAFSKPGDEMRKNDEPVEKGDTYNWLWHGYPDDASEVGTILEINGKDQLKFSFGKAGNCTVRIYQEQGETIVELVQDEIPTDDEGMKNYHCGCTKGWTFYLANMKSLFEGGIDLRNKNLELKRVVNS
jgi:uncharacterized protein YndB with AHSA1/START domain